MRHALSFLFFIICCTYQLSAQCPRQIVIDNYQNKYLTSQFTDAELNWTGNTTDCTIGNMSESVRVKQLQKINYYRELVGGLNPVTLEAVKNSQAMAAVLMYEAEDNYSHCEGNNGAPCNTWACTSSDAIEAASRSNIASSFPNWDLEDPIDVYMRDDGEFNEAVAHRRWILNSRAEEMGIATSTRFNAMYVIDNNNTTTPTYNQFIAYPPAGFMPQDLVPSRWSFSIPDADFSNATVAIATGSGSTITNTITEKNITFFADNSIVWEPSGIVTNDTSDVTYTVTISNIEDAPQSSYSYTSTIIPVSTPLCPDGESYVTANCQCEVVATCPDRGILLTSQEEVDAFLQDYPNCTRINGAININQEMDKTPITNLNGLSNITHIEDGLGINGTQLVNLEGLSQLTRIEGALLISNNDNLLNLNGLDQLSYVGLDLYLNQNTLLNNISSLASLTSIQRELILFDNSALSSLNGLHNIERIETDFLIFDHPLLESLEDFIALEYIGGFIAITSNAALSTCDNNNLCAIFDTKTGSNLEIALNALGCNSPLEVQAICNPVIPSTCSSAEITIDSLDGTACPSNLFVFQTDITASSYSWDFGDGSLMDNSSDFVAFKSYNTPGSYTIQVFLTYEDGCLDTTSTQLIIGDPTSTFTYTLDGNTINLVADATDVTSYDWDFGDGAIASGLTPQTSYTYTSPGTYRVSLTKRGLCESSSFQDIMVGELVPENTSATCADGIDNDGDGQVDSDDPNCECSLSNGEAGCCDDYGFSIGTTPATLGNADGLIRIRFLGASFDLSTYDIQTDDNLVFSRSTDGFIASNVPAGTYSYTISDNVGNGCVHSFSTTVDSTISCDDLSLIISESSIDCGLIQFTAIPSGGTPPYQYNWVADSTNTSDTFISADHFFGQQTLQITDANNCMVTENYTVPLTTINVQAAFTYAITSDSILFTNTSTGEVVAQQWTFNLPNTIVNNRTVLPPVGSYEICLIVSNNCDQTDTQCQTIEVIATVDPNAENTASACSDGIDNDGDGLIDLLDEECAFARCGNLEIITSSSVSGNKHCERFHVTFQEISRDPVVSHEWDFGTGRTEGFSRDTPTPITFTGENYADPGIYVVKLTATYPNGCIDSTSQEIEIISSSTSISYEVSEDGLTYTFSADQTNAEYINNYLWDIDGRFVTSRESSFTHTFPESGDYRITLTLNADCPTSNPSISVNVMANIPENTPEACSDGVDNDGDGLIDMMDEDCSFVRCGTLQITPPFSHISENKYCLRDQVTFRSSGGENVLSYEWDLGRGYTPGATFPTPNSIPQVSEHYGEPGIYTVKLKATFADGCIDSTSHEIEIVTSETNITYDVADDGLTYTFSADQTYGEYINSYRWMNLDDLSVYSFDSTFTHTFSENGNYLIDLSTTGFCPNNSASIRIDVDVVANVLENTPSACSDGIDNDGDGLIDLLDEECAFARCGNLEIIPQFTTIGDNKYCQFNPIIYTVSGGDSVSSFEWDYGNGTGTSTNFDTPQAVFHGNGNYNPGNYTVKLKATLANGCIDSTSYEVEIVSSHSSISYEVANDGLTYTFMADQTNGEYIDSYRWDLVGEGISNGFIDEDKGPTFTYTFSENGNYHVALRPQGNCQGNFETINIDVVANAPENTPEACSDGLDNDKDGLVDCEDSDCPCVGCPVDLTLTRQSQVDSFVINYPGCREILGTLTIASGNSITNLDKLENIANIGGDLIITNNNNNINLNGLQYLGAIGGNLMVDNNPQLSDFFSMYRLRKIGGDLVIGENTSLSGLFSPFTNIPIDTINGSVRINGATQLISLEKIGSVKAIGGDFEISNQPILQNVKGIDSLITINGSLIITNNPQLTSIENLINITTLNGAIQVENNTQLTSLAGLDNIDASTITSLSLLNSPQLSFCAIQSICDYIEGNGPRTISGNAATCATSVAIQTACSNNVIIPLFEDYPWLLSSVNPNNCNGEKITEYSAHSGQVFVFVEIPNSNPVLYLNDSRVWCSGYADDFCTIIYQAKDILRTWECGEAAPIDADMDNVLSDADPDDNDPCVPSNQADLCDRQPSAPDFIGDYPWLADVIDFDNCTTQQITIYQTGSFQYLYVQSTPDAFGILYNAAGLFYCASSANYDCVSAYSLSEIVDTWLCGDAPTIVLVDNDNDGSLSNVDPNDNDPCVPDNTSTACSTDTPEGEGEAAPPTFLSDYPWLSDVMDFDNCTTQQITIYQTGVYQYLYIQDTQDAYGTLYNAAGQFYCASSANYDCVSAYSLSTVVDTWLCGDAATVVIVDNDNDGSLSDVDPDDTNPCVPDNTSTACDMDTATPVGNAGPPDFLPDYPWIENFIDFDNCGDASIQVYRSSGYVYVFIETATMAVLFNSGGATYCTNSLGYECREFYTNDEDIAQWNCGDSSTPIETPIDSDGDGVLSDIDPDDTNPCVPDDSACQDTGEGESEPPSFLSDYPWLSDLIDFDNCADETVQVYRSSGYVYLMITTANSSILYNSTGLTYCTNSTNYDCQTFYSVDEEIDFWSCGDAAPSVALTDQDNDGYLSDVDTDDMDPCVPDNATAACQELSGDFPVLFETYPWLATLINPFNCTTDQVTVYALGIYRYLVVEHNGSTIMYNEAGLTYCTSSVGYDCVALYNLEEVVDSWVCANSLKEDCIQYPERCINKPQLKISTSARAWDFKVFPNPTTGYFSIELASTNSEQLISVINIQGQKVYQNIRPATEGAEVFPIDLSNATKGIYLVQIQNDTEVVTKRLVVH